MPVSFEEIMARPTAPAPGEGGGPAATTGPVSFDEIMGIPPASSEPSVWGFVKDTQSWKDMLSTPAAVGNMLLSGAGMLMGAGAGTLGSAVSMIPNPLGSTPELRAGLPREKAVQRGGEASGKIGEALSPMGIAKNLGYTPDKTVVDTAMEMVSKGITKYGTVLEAKYRYPDGTPVILTGEVEAVFNLLLGYMGTKPFISPVNKMVKGQYPAGAVPAQPSSFPDKGILSTLARTPEEIRTGKLSIPKTPQAGGQMSVEAARATYAEPRVQEAAVEPPTYGELPYRSVTPIPKTAEQQAAALKESEKSMKAAVKAETPAQRTARMTVNALPEGEAIWTSGTTDYPVRVTGEPVRGPDGKMYTPVQHGDTPSFVPTAELKRGTVPPEVPQPLRVDYAEANDIAQIPGSQRTPEQMIRLRQHLRNLGGNQLGRASAEQLAWVAAGVGGALYLSQQDFDKLPGDAAGLIMAAGAIKGPGGFFPLSTVDKVAKPFMKDINIREKVEAIPGIREMTQAEQVVKAREVYDQAAAAPRRMVKNWLTRYAGTAADPLKDITLPVNVRDANYHVTGTTPVRWEDIIDQILKKSAPDTQGESVPGGFTAYPNLKQLPENEASWTISEYDAGGAKFDPRTGDTYWRRGETPPSYETLPEERLLTYRGNAEGSQKLNAYRDAFTDILDHAGDYYSTLDPVKRASYDLPRLIKETLADDIKKVKEAAAYKEASKKARVESAASNDVVVSYPEVELPERVLHRNSPSGTSAQRMVEEILPAGRTKFSWVQLKKPGQFFDEGRFMAHSVGGYDIVEGQPGWTPASGTKKQNTYATDYYGLGGHEAITSGKAEVYSLRDKEGNSYATFEIEKKPSGKLSIKQMKGPGNKNVSEEAQRYAQDFATDPKWDKVNEGDLGKIGLTLEQFNNLREAKLKDLPRLFDSSVKRNAGDLIDPAALASIAAAVGIGAYALNTEDKEGAAMLGMGAIVAGRGRVPFKGIAESKLLDYVRAGSEGAASELYARGKTQIEKTARRFGPEAEDIAQRSWEKAFRAVKSGAFQGDAQFMTYLTRIVLNEGINKGKFEGRRPTVSMEEGKTAGPEGESRGGIEDTLGHVDTPEKAQLSKELGERVAAAMERVDPNMRESFLLREVEGLDYAEIAERRGIPIGTVRSQISRVKESLQQMLRQDADIAKGQQGYSTPGLAVGLGATTAGAAIGALVNPENPLEGSVYGALAGGVLGFREGRAALKNAIASPDTALGLLSTRLANIAQELKFSLRNNARSVLKEVERANDAVFPFLQALNKLPEDRAIVAGRALMNGNTAEIMRVPELASTYPAVQKFLGTIESELKGLGRFGEGVVGYFPRIVKDLEGLKTALGQSAKEGLEKVLLDAEASMMRKKHRGLTDIERSLVVNRYLFAPDRTSFQPGFAKARGVKEITPELQKFYASPSESLLRYVSGAVTDIQTAKFFGRDLVTSKAGKQLYNDIDSSIGSLTERMLKEGKISSALQARQLRDMLKAYFEGGQQAMNPTIAAVRDLSNAGLLGNVVAAATQIGDSLASVYHQNLVNVLQAVGEKLIGKERITPKQMGLINHVAEELSGGGFTGRVVQTSLKYSAFKAVDMFAKGLNLNAALIKATGMAQTLSGQAKLRAKYQAAFGSEMDLFLGDLRSRRVTDRVEQFLFNELSDAQPISRVEMPELYLKHPNGRVLYQMKTYMLKQSDIVRRDAYQNIASGEPKRILEGTKNLAALATVYALSNIPGDLIKDWISGRPGEDLLSTPKLVENVLKTFGLNRYATEKLEKGKVVETAQGILTPPVKVFENVGRTASSLLSKDETNWIGVSHIPVAGKPIYDRWLGGNIKREIAETGIKNQDRPAGYKIKLSPEAQAYIKSRRDAAKAEAPARERARFEKMQSQ